MKYEKITAAAVRRAFNDLTGPQISRRNAAFSEGWRIAYHWCGTYDLAKGDQMVARVVKGSHGGLTITMW